MSRDLETVRAEQLQLDHRITIIEDRLNDRQLQAAMATRTVWRELLDAAVIGTAAALVIYVVLVAGPAIFGGRP